MSVRPGFVVFVRGPLGPYLDAVDDLLVRVQSGLFRKTFAVYRAGSDTTWADLPAARDRVSFTELFGMRGTPAGTSIVELAEHGREMDRRTGMQLFVNNLGPARGMDRASYIHVLFDADTAATTIAGLGEWAINALPVWWGAAGFVFRHSHGTLVNAHDRMAALAKRYWGVQIQDLTALQWDAILGIPSVNWLTLIGDQFAQSRGISPDELATVAASLQPHGVVHRRGAHGVAIAAGRAPLLGDINIGEDVETYVRLAHMLDPLVMAEHTPLFGAFADPEVLRAWLGRFTSPQAWFDTRIETN